MNKFFSSAGKMAIGSRLRILSEHITKDAEKINNLYGVDLKPKWFPVFFVLSKNQTKSITTLAEEIGHSHPSVSKIVREMSKHRVVVEKKGKTDKRKNVISLTSKGKKISAKIQPLYSDVGNAIEEVLSQTKHNIWYAIEELEFLLNQMSLPQRVEEQKKKREAKNVKIIPYQSKYQKDFEQLNKEWITTYFRIEEADIKVLENPKKYIIDKGGLILVALYNDKPVGVCALLKMNDPVYDFELAKMAVSIEARGKGIGWLLGNAIIEQAKSLGAKKIYLESNTLLKPAINLYQKLNFSKVTGHPTPYKRSNIQMELILD